MEAASASSSTKPRQSDMIFLSHSGKQKGNFVHFLYDALRSARYQVFFDMDYRCSLPLAHSYPPRIFQECRDCKVAMVVLSNDYVESLWPMLELQHILHPSRPDGSILPLFYELKPGDLSHPDKANSWQKCWAQHEADWNSKMQNVQADMSSMGSELQINLDTKSWPGNLRKLQQISGSVRRVFHADSKQSFYESDFDYIQEIMSNFRVSFPMPVEYSLEPGITGQTSMQQEIVKVFQQKGSIGTDEVEVIGVHGIPGSGKSTLCKIMANFYGSKFGGECFYLEFPSNGGDYGKILLKAIGCPVEGVPNVDKAMAVLGERLRRRKLFLAIDNIWGPPHESYEHAKRIMLMKFQPGSKIMLTSRGKDILSSLLGKRPAMENMMMANGQSHPSVVHVPCLTEAEAVESIKSRYGCSSSDSIPQDCLCRLARSCYFEGKCHPLYLKLKVHELEQMGKTSFTDQQWRDIISGLEVWGGASAQTDSVEEVVLRTVGKSLEALPPGLQGIFIDLAAAWPKICCFYELGLPTFVRYHYDDCTEQDMNYKVLKLQHHGLLDVEFNPDYCEGDPDKIVIHDLLKLVANRRRSRPHVNSVAKDAIIDEDLSVITWTDDQLLQKKHISGRNLTASTWRALFGSSTTPSSGISMLSWPVRVQIRSLVSTWRALFRSSSPVRVQIRSLVIYRRAAVMPACNCLRLKNNGRDMKALRVLHLEDVKGLTEIEGWEGVPNLMVLTLNYIDGLKRIGSIGCLARLERLVLCGCRELQIQALVGAGAEVSLVRPGDKLPMLQRLWCSCLWHLKEVGPRLFDAFPALKVLALQFCHQLESFPDFNAGTLGTLDLEGCQNLKSIEGIDRVSSLTALQRLVLTGCNHLSRMSNISNVERTDLRYLDALGCPPALGNHLRLMMVGSCSHHTNRLQVLSLQLSIPSEKYDMNGTDEVGRDEMNHESSGSTSYNDSAAASRRSSIPALRLRDAVFSCGCDNCRIQLNEGMAHFVHLQQLHISAKLEAQDPCWLDVSGLPRNLKSLELKGGFKSVQMLDVSDLPESLERLNLTGFSSVKKLVISSSLVNLSFLKVARFRALEEISGLGAHHAQLAELSIEECPLMENLFDANAQLPGLQDLRLNKCNLAELSNLATISPSLVRLDIRKCNSLKDVSGVAGLTKLRSLYVGHCKALTPSHIPNLRHLGALTRFNIEYDRREEDSHEMVSNDEQQLPVRPRRSWSCFSEVLRFVLASCFSW